MSINFDSIYKHSKNMNSYFAASIHSRVRLRIKMHIDRLNIPYIKTRLVSPDLVLYLGLVL